MEVMVGSERIDLPQSFDGLIAIFEVEARDVDAAIEAARAGERLLRFATDPGRRARLRAAYASASRSPWPVLRAIAAHGIRAMSAAVEDAPVLTELLTDGDATVRGSAAQALAAVDPLGAAPRLHALALAEIVEGHPREAARAAAMLVDLGSDELTEALFRDAAATALDGVEPSRRRAATAALGALATHASRCAADASRVLRALTDADDARLRREAVTSLARLERPAGAPSPATPRSELFGG